MSDTKAAEALVYNNSCFSFIRVFSLSFLGWGGWWWAWIESKKKKAILTGAT